MIYRNRTNTAASVNTLPYAVAALPPLVNSFSAGAATGLTPNTATTGNVVLGGTLAAGNGGTGVATLPLNNVILGNATSAVQAVAPSTSGNVLTSNGTTWTSTARPAIVPKVQVFTASGTFTVPANVTAIKVTVQAAGGPSFAGGGGCAIKWISGLVPAATITATVGGIGGASSFGAYCSATPGINNGIGGVGVGGDINLGGGVSNNISFSCGKCFGGGGVSGDSFLGGIQAFPGGANTGGAIMVEWFTYG